MGSNTLTILSTANLPYYKKVAPLVPLGATVKYVPSNE